MKYFIVTAKCGHVGRMGCIWIDFAVAAENAKAAAAKAKGYKRVKHDHKDAIRGLREVSFEEFLRQRDANDRDPYLHCKNIQEQRKLEGLESRIEPDELNIMLSRQKKHRHTCPEYNLKRDRIMVLACRRQIEESLLENEGA